MKMLKTLITILLMLVLATLTWMSLGWVSLLVIPSITLFALMTFAPLLSDWAQREALSQQNPAIEKQSAPC